MGIDNSDFLQRLTDVTGDNGVIEDPSRGPGPIVRPRSTEEVSEIMKACTEHKVPVVTFGGNTGLVQGTHRTGAELGLSMERMNSIEEIDVAGRTMTVQAWEIGEESSTVAPSDQGNIWRSLYNFRNSCGQA